MSDTSRKQYLLEKYLHDDCTLQELEELYESLATEEDTAPYKEVLQALWLEIKAEKSMSADRAKNMLEHIFSSGKKNRPGTRSSFYWKAAAILLPAVAAATIYWQLAQHRPYTSAPPAKMVAQASQHSVRTILPGSHKAILVLGNGRQLDLTDSAQKQVLKNNGIQVANNTNRLVYNNQAPEDTALHNISYNSLITPRGGEYTVVLADGTKVWLNAASSLRYPTRFSGNERKVELTGEAYFEVVHNASRPFVVMVSGVKVTDLGTRFNINAYADEPFMKTTLAQGKLGVEKAGNGKMIVLAPGYEVLIDKMQKMKVVKANLKDALAWKNGLFSFSTESLGSIMRKLSRWYDADVKFDDVKEEELHFTGTVHKYEKIETVLQMLELTNEVKFIVRGKTLEVKRK